MRSEDIWTLIEIVVGITAMFAVVIFTRWT
jgi:hypothetical protein